ncbi:zinc transporter ZupT [Alkalibacter mobilis]|uniref:zinc transporter ZupT n=1 Tax=Alkalibacter mobilis TaxID=2787712 RepID=UPI0018A0AE18|nr:zinc transporter ZupT [Alkalibacter mobilis]MBF7097371.1 zinc transporter ZupT [Alkalibacter mobilis]
MEFSTSNIIFAFALTLLAGLSTGIGSALAFYTKQTNTKFLSAALGFSAGVMIYVSFVEIFPKAFESLTKAFGDGKGQLVATLAFFSGMALIALIDKLVPSSENPHEIRDVDEMNNDSAALMRMGLFSALAIGIHNFPEGIATFISALKDPQLGISIAVAIAIHNIPEGIAVSVPIFYATGSRRKAFSYSFLSGLSEPVGALIGFLFLMRFMNDQLFGLIFAGVAGIMVYISLDELLPAAEKYGEHHIAIYGLISGMVVMAASLIII